MYVIDSQVSSIKLLEPQTLLAMQVAGDLYTKVCGHDLRITSIYRPDPKSLHSKGLAFDCGCNTLKSQHPAITRHEDFINLVSRTLSPLGYDVVHETPETTGKPEHLHIEYDPKG